MPLINARPAALQLSSSSRAFSVAVPARLANAPERTQSNPKARTGFLAEKGPFPFQQRAMSYDEVVARSKRQADLEELVALRSLNKSQERKIEVLKGTVSELLAGEKGSTV